MGLSLRKKSVVEMTVLRSRSGPLLEIEVHPGHCYLRAKHGHEQSEGKHVKG